MPRIWIVRADEGASRWKEFLDDGFIGIGYGVSADLTESEDIVDHRRAIAEGRDEQNNSSTSSRWANQLWAFIREMQIGDEVITPVRS